jgi:hypothetical protein
MFSGRETVQHALSPRPFHPTKRVGYCWIGRGLIISGSAENRGNSCHLSDQPTPAQASLLEILVLGPSCISSTPQLKRE